MCGVHRFVDNYVYKWISLEEKMSKFIVIKKKNLIVAGAIALGTVFLVLLLTLPFGRTNAASGKITVVVDAGHGGIDAGAVGESTGVKESELNLYVAKKLKERLTASGINVVMTRETHDGLYGLATNGFKRRDMQKRKEIINESMPNLVISVHMNISSVKSVKGAQVFYYKGSENSKLLAEGIQQSLNTGMEYVKPRVALTGDYYMLNCTQYTSVIVECGFLSNTEEEQLLKQDAYQDKLAQFIAEGALKYLDEKSTLSELYETMRG